MELLKLRRQFERTVAPLEIGGPLPTGRRTVFPQPGQFALDVARDGRDEAFVLRLGEGADERWRFMVSNADPARRHLLLLATMDRELGIRIEAPRQFLCGHDERHLFVAGLTATVATVAEAMTALKPEAVLASEAASGVRAKERNRRRNAAFVRQGEWFFLPRPHFVPRMPTVVQHNEPISRGIGKAHLVEYLYREGSGERVWVCAQHPRGVDEKRYRDLIRNAERAKWNWQLMYRTTLVYARGKIRHPDHATIYLPFWHQVVPNAEAGAGSATRQSVAFLD